MTAWKLWHGSYAALHITSLDDRQDNFWLNDYKTMTTPTENDGSMKRLQKEMFGPTYFVMALWSLIKSKKIFNVIDRKNSNTNS